MAENELVKVRIEDSIGIVTVDNPPVNALNSSVLEQLDKVIDDVSDNKEIVGIVLTGGGAKLLNATDLAEEVFQMPIKIGKPDSINGIIDIINNPRYATTIGLIKYIAENNEIKKGYDDKDLDLIDVINKYYKRIIIVYSVTFIEI